MQIYLDYIFLENLIVNTVIIIETIIFTKSDISIKRKVFIILLDTILSCFLAINTNLNTYILHLFFSTITLFILFKSPNIYELLKKMACYYMLYFLYMGLIISFCIIFNINLEVFINKIILYVFSALVFHFICKDLWKMWKINITQKNLYYTLKFKKIEIKAFVDTGNSIKDPITSLDVIFINEQLKYSILNEIKEYKKINIDVLTINGKDTKEGYIVKDVIVYKEKREIAKISNIILSFSLNNSSTPEKYSAIIGYDTYLDKLEGVIL
ncbi:MAG: sigma-E processing peptidase SpoIIGA [Clostridia bacterium]|nr:sigma-E processing peptidase SpoIIGA [Clostridia bacterium]